MRKWTAVATTQIPKQQKEHRQGVKAEIRAYFARPKDHFKRHKRSVKATAPREHIQKPDGDNIAKFTLDCLSGLAYHDDAQIHTLRVDKLWTTDEQGRVEVDLMYGRRNTRA